VPRLVAVATVASCKHGPAQLGSDVRTVTDAELCGYTFPGERYLVVFSPRDADPEAWVERQSLNRLIEMLTEKSSVVGDYYRPGPAECRGIDQNAGKGETPKDGNRALAGRYLTTVMPYEDPLPPQSAGVNLVLRGLDAQPRLLDTALRAVADRFHAYRKAHAADPAVNKRTDLLQLMIVVEASDRRDIGAFEPPFVALETPDDRSFPYDDLVTKLRPFLTTKDATSFEARGADEVFLIVDGQRSGSMKDALERRTREIRGPGLVEGDPYTSVFAFLSSDPSQIGRTPPGGDLPSLIVAAKEHADSRRADGKVSLGELRTYLTQPRYVYDPRIRSAYLRLAAEAVCERGDVRNFIIHAGKYAAYFNQMRDNPRDAVAEAQPVRARVQEGLGRLPGLSALTSPRPIFVHNVEVSRLETLVFLAPGQDGDPIAAPPPDNEDVVETAFALPIAAAYLEAAREIAIQRADGSAQRTEERRLAVLETKAHETSNARRIQEALEKEPAETDMQQRQKQVKKEKVEVLWKQAAIAVADSCATLPAPNSSSPLR
jgi:hypothetical protein